MKKWNKAKKILLGLLILFLATQAIQPSKNQGSPAGSKDVLQTLTVPDSVISVLKRSCYDCHSNYTNYPWYNNLTPVNWWVAGHINEGKSELNFSNFGEYSSKTMSQKLEGIAETVEREIMPLPSYLWAHGDARLSDIEKKLIIDWANASRRKVSLK